MGKAEIAKTYATALGRRPLLAAMRPQVGSVPVLLIDKLRCTDARSEAILLKALSDFQATFPDLG